MRHIGRFPISVRTPLNPGTVSRDELDPKIQSFVPEWTGPLLLQKHETHYTLTPLHGTPVSKYPEFAHLPDFQWNGLVFETYSP